MVWLNGGLRMGKDLSINGLGSAAGGAFQRAEINGKGTIHGDIDCVHFESNGRGVVNGEIKARTVDINGSATLNGNIDAITIEMNGHARIYGNIAGKEIEIAGSTVIEGNLKARKVNLQGKVTVRRDCEAEAFESDGRIIIGDQLNAGHIDITLRGEARAKGIGGQTVKVRRRMPGWMKWILIVFQPRLYTGRIEGDEIDLEHTKAEMVRGNNVRIGPGCEVGLVEYRGDIQEDKGAKVREKRKV
ncbi:MAG TPA: polymer-forming cytoskeletal protein [Bacillales bacterium]